MSHGWITIKDYEERARAFEEEALRIFAKYDSPQARVFSLSSTRRKLSQLSLRQETLFDQAIRCAEFGLPRAAIVVAWSAFVNYYVHKLGDNVARIHELRPNWVKFRTIDDIVEQI